MNTNNICFCQEMREISILFCRKKSSLSGSMSDCPHSGPSCSKLTTSLVNDSLKFTSSDMQIC